MKTIKVYQYYFFAFFVLGILVYFPVFFNGFVWDDFVYIINNPKLHHISLSLILNYGFDNSTVFRIITPFYFAFVYTLFGPNPFSFHLIQLLLHIICTSLIFILFTKYFSPKIAFLLALLFLIHPINVESVVWVSTVQHQIFTILGITSLLIVQNKNLRTKNILVVTILLTISALTYEEGILYTVLVLFYLYLQNKLSLKKALILLCISLSIYLLLRYMLTGHFMSLLIESPETVIPLTEKIFTIPSIISYYLKTFIYPLDLYIWQYWTIREISFDKVIIPAIIIQAVLTIYFINIKYVKKQKKEIIFFTVWFVLGMLAVLQIIPFEMTVSDRWFYFPFIGLLGIIGFWVQHYGYKFTKVKKVCLVAIILLFCLYSYRTFVRISDWKDNLTLYSHDLKYEINNSHLNYDLAMEYLDKKEYKSATFYLERVNTYSSHYALKFQLLGAIYEYMGDYKKALFYIRKAIDEQQYSPREGEYDIYVSYSNCLLKTSNYDEVNNVLTNRIINSSHYPTTLLYYRALARYQLHKYNEAFLDAKVLVKESHEADIQDLFNKIQNALLENNNE